MLGRAQASDRIAQSQKMNATPFVLTIQCSRVRYTRAARKASHGTGRTEAFTSGFGLDSPRVHTCWSNSDLTYIIVWKRWHMKHIGRALSYKWKIHGYMHLYKHTDLQAVSYRNVHSNELEQWSHLLHRMTGYPEVVLLFVYVIRRLNVK